MEWCQSILACHQLAHHPTAVLTGKGKKKTNENKNTNATLIVLIFLDVAFQLKHSFSSPSGDFAASWAPSADQSSINFTISAKTTGWISIGFGSTPLMTMNMDSVVAWVSSGEPTLLDTFSTSYDQPGEFS